MEQKKEVQVKVLKEPNEKATKEEFFQILRQVSPGTHLRSALEGVVKANKGALIVVENPELQEILDGGFKINSRFTHQRLVELAKMDGAIILSQDMKRITYANVTLAPDTRIPSHETGTRHKAAERTARMTKTLTIAISERKGEINIYYKDTKYLLRETVEILRRAQETLQILEKQRELYDDHIAILHAIEVADEPHLDQACKVIQKGKTMEKLIQSQEKTLIELGNEGAALKLRIKELMKGIPKETDLVIKDYTKLNLKKSKNILDSLSYEELIDPENILGSLAQKGIEKLGPIRGWRVLAKTTLSEKEKVEVTKNFKNISSILNAKKEDFHSALTEERSAQFSKELEKIKNI